MGVDISHLIKNDFYEVENHEKALQYVKDTIALLIKKLHLPTEEEISWEIQDNYIDPDSTWQMQEITFRVPVYDVEFSLHNGFWVIESYHHYCQIVMHHGEYFWLRELTFDLARALNQSEAWYAEEFYTWNGGPLEEAGPSFEEWVKWSENKYGNKIPEFDQEAIMAQGDVHIPNYEPIYHDVFKECIAKYTELQNKLSDKVKLLGLHRTGKFLRCEVDGNLNLYNEDANSFVFTEPIEGLIQSLNGPEFLVLKNGKTALFDGDGNALSDFVEGEWQWEWAAGNYPHRRLFNNKANLSFIVES